MTVIVKWGREALQSIGYQRRQFTRADRYVQQLQSQSSFTVAPKVEQALDARALSVFQSSGQVSTPVVGVQRDAAEERLRIAPPRRDGNEAEERLRVAPPRKVISGSGGGLPGAPDTQDSPL